MRCCVNCRCACQAGTCFSRSWQWCDKMQAVPVRQQQQQQQPCKAEARRGIALSVSESPTQIFRRPERLIYCQHFLVVTWLGQQAAARSGHGLCRTLTSNRAASRPAARSHSPCRLVTRQRGGRAARRRPRCAASAGERRPEDRYEAL